MAAHCSIVKLIYHKCIQQKNKYFGETIGDVDTIETTSFINCEEGCQNQNTRR